MRLTLALDQDAFARHLAREIAVGGLAVVDAIERFLSEWLEDSVSHWLGDRLVKAPRAIVHPEYYADRFQNLANLSQEGYMTWYPEVRFSTQKDDLFEVSSLETSGFELGSIKYSGGLERSHSHRVKVLKTQTNHSVCLDKVTIPSSLMEHLANEVSNVSIHQPYIANLTVGFDRLVDDRIEGYRAVAFDHVVTGRRLFCDCHFGAHAAMLADAKAMRTSFVPGAWPHRVIDLLERAAYKAGLCHLCIAIRNGPDAPFERYGAQVRRHFSPYVDLLVRGERMDQRTAKAEAKRRLGIGRWSREEKLYELVTRLFPLATVRREASPEWLGQQRLDIYLPELGLAIEHQGEQHYSPIAAFGGTCAFEKTQERDKRKRSLCRKNGVAVVDIRFDYPLTFSGLRARLQHWLARQTASRRDSE